MSRKDIDNCMVISPAEGSVALHYYRVLLLTLSMLLAGCDVQQAVDKRTSSSGNGAPVTPSDSDAAMRFTVVLPCQNSLCEPMMIGEGTITSDTPIAYGRAIAQQPHVKSLVLVSPGGNLLAGMELGRKVRASGINTLAPSDASRHYIQRAQCYSACGYAFLGGVRRKVENGAKLGFHQFSSADNTQSNSDSQLLMAEIGRYLDDMGVDRRLSDLSARTSSQDIAIITSPEAVRLNVDNSMTLMTATPTVDGVCTIGNSEFIVLSNAELQNVVRLETIPAVESKPPPPNPICADPNRLPGAEYLYCHPIPFRPFVIVPERTVEVITPFPTLISNIEKNAGKRLCRQQVIYLWDRMKREVLIPRITGSEYQINAALQAEDSHFERFLWQHESRR